ncbi:MAG TPA: hypothetical protein VKU02_31920 [Gemmataceae bacterium]|nr:hypothetical protein [Gemmataceae bacterium]
MRPFFGSISGIACLLGLAAVLVLPVQIQAQEELRSPPPIDITCGPEYSVSGSGGLELNVCGTSTIPIDLTCKVEDCGQIELFPHFADILILTAHSPSAAFYIPLAVNVRGTPVSFTLPRTIAPNSLGFLQLSGNTPKLMAPSDPHVTVSMLFDVDHGEIDDSSFVAYPYHMSPPGFPDAIGLAFDITTKHPHDDPTVTVAIQISVDGVPVVFQPAKHGGDGDPD